VLFINNNEKDNNIIKGLPATTRARRGKKQFCFFKRDWGYITFSCFFLHMSSLLFSFCAFSLLSSIKGGGSYAGYGNYNQGAEPTPYGDFMHPVHYGNFYL
jgi:hypothetical protein